MAIPELHIDLDQAPEERWSGLRDYAAPARELIAYYVADLGGIEQFGDMLLAYRDAVVSDEYANEVRGIAKAIGVSEPEALLANLYYDAIKQLFCCTAFAVDTDEGPLHARNLDWGTIDQLLSRHTLIINFRRRGEVLYRAVSWPGFAGVLSGMAPGRFAVTLNAVLSEEPPQLAPPVAFLIREVLENAPGFDEAVEMLASATIPSDCLLLVTGPNSGQMAVIERAPTRHALRKPENGFIIVTNDFRRLAADESGAGISELARTSCGRFDRVAELLARQRPTTPAECFDVLGDPRVRMNITMQSMVMLSQSGHLAVRRPEDL
jgi:hypothetical protein